MGNVNDHRHGQQVRLLPTATGNCLTPDFPGWGAPDYADYLTPVAQFAGQIGIVRSVNSHGSNPWTRYSILIETGHYLIDGIEGRDFEWRTL